VPLRAAPVLGEPRAPSDWTKNGPLSHPNDSGAIDADQGLAGSGRDPAAVLDQKARCTGELVGLFRDHRHGQFLAGQIHAGGRPQHNATLMMTPVCGPQVSLAAMTVPTAGP
jgi:hypothetical protein